MGWQLYALIILAISTIVLIYKYISANNNILELKFLNNSLEAIKVEAHSAVSNLQNQINEMTFSHNNEIALLKEKYDKLINQKKSSEVRLGQIGEHLAPFMSKWPFDTKNFRFIGSPIDGISFEEDKIVFVEIKTGKSALSSKQRSIRSLVEEGKLEFLVYKIGEEGVAIS